MHEHETLPQEKRVLRRYGHETLPQEKRVLRRYGHETLPGGVTYRRCVHCERHHNRYSQYCSNACKQAAYRRRHDKHSGTLKRRRERAQRAVRTKQIAKTTLTCEFCGLDARVSIAESTNRRYCSNACKQAAYRQRKVKV